MLDLLLIILLTLLGLGGWAANILGLPGNWLIVTFAALYAYLLPAGIHPRGSWAVVGVLLGLAVLSEVLEFFAGAAGAAKHGGSRKGMMLAVAGAFVGSLAGAALLSPIPIIGPVIGALGGGAVNAADAVKAVAEKLVRAVESRRPKVRYYVCTPTYAAAVLKRVLPYRLLDRVARETRHRFPAVHDLAAELSYRNLDGHDYLNRANCEYYDFLDRIYVEQGTTLTRSAARAKGRGARISKPTCHIYVTVGN